MRGREAMTGEGKLHAHLSKNVPILFKENAFVGPISDELLKDLPAGKIVDEVETCHQGTFLTAGSPGGTTDGP